MDAASNVSRWKSFLISFGHPSASSYAKVLLLFAGYADTPTTITVSQFDSTHLHLMPILTPVSLHHLCVFPNDIEQCGATALMRAEDRGHLDVIKLLVDYTASKVSLTCHTSFK